MKTNAFYYFQNCLVFIMDHLSKVTSQSSRNKMNPHNLAICFAPVLMMDFSSQAAAAADPTGAAAAAVAAVAGQQAAVPNISEPIQILTYLVEIWPRNQE